jgi:hypothetical protein
MTPEQYRLCGASRRIGQAFGTGGTTWNVSSTSGDGISTPAETSAGNAITGYVLIRPQRPFDQASAPLPQRTADHVLVLLSGTVAIGDTLTSATDSTFILRVESIYEGLPNAYLLLQQR